MSALLRPAFRWPILARSMHATARGWCRPALALAALLAAGCSSATFSSAGSGGSGGSAGGDGGAGCPTTCKSGEYCQASSGHCISCGDFSKLDFGPPEPLAAVNGNPSGDLRFPRVAGSNGDALLYVADNHALSPPGRQIWLAAKPDTDYGIRVSADSASASGPLYVQFDYASTPKADVVFDRVEAPGQNPKRDLYATSLAAQSYPWTPSRLNAPLNAVGADDYSIAVAPGLPRAWWMSDRDTGAAHLVTLGLGSTGTAQEVSLSIRIDAQVTCLTPDKDLTPWATPDGSVMLFSAVRRGSGCHPDDSQKRGLYWVKLGPNGHPDGGAAGQALDVNQMGVDQTDPSLSSDLCTLYYAADDGNGFKLYRAPRR